MNPHDLDDTRQGDQSLRESRAVADGERIAIGGGVPDECTAPFPRAWFGSLFTNPFECILNIFGCNSDGSGVARKKGRNVPGLHGFANGRYGQHCHRFFAGLCTFAV